MSELEKTTGLGESSGSDGSLSKDLSHNAEINFSVHGVKLPFEEEFEDSVNIEKGNEEAEENSFENNNKQKHTKNHTPYNETSLVEGEQPDSDIDALMFCEHCQGPIVKLKKFDNSGKQFCSKRCAESQHDEAQDFIDEEVDDVLSKIQSSPQDAIMDSTEELHGEDNSSSHVTIKTESRESQQLENFPADFDWNHYSESLMEQAAPINCFTKLPKAVKGLKPGMKLEALDKNNPHHYCVATVIDVVGHRVKIRYDGFGNDESQDFWCNFQAMELFPIGWCAENSFPLKPPTGISSSLEDWKTFLTKTLTGALAAPLDLFRENEKRLQSKVYCFQAGMKVECVHPRRPSIICPATITNNLGPFSYQITTEPLPNLPAHTFSGHGHCTGVFHFGWSKQHGIDLALPIYVEENSESKEKFFNICKAKSAPPIPQHRRMKNIFKVGHKMEAVDLQNPSIIRVGTVFSIHGRLLRLLFDGCGKFQYVDYESEDIYPIGWCLKTGHPLTTSFGNSIQSMAEQTSESELVPDDNSIRSVTLPSFLTVLGKQNSCVKGELNKKIKAKIENVSNNSTPVEIQSSMPQDSSEKKPDDSERVDDSFCVYFNKSCLIGPHLDAQKVAGMPDCTASAKTTAAVRFALEKIIEVSIDPIETMDAVQDGFGAKLFSKGKRKVLKKGLFRFDTKLRAGRFLKRLCKRLKSCEYFLSFDPAKNPCPLECQTSGTISLESFVTMKGIKTREDLQTNQLEDLRRKRGRPRKEDFEPLTLDKTADFNRNAEVMGTHLKSPIATQVRLLNPTSYHGRPLVPIAPGSKVVPSPVSIMPVGTQVHHVRQPPPYDVNGRSFVQQIPANTVVTSATQSRMVTPVNLRMLSPGTPAAVAADPSTPSFASQNVTTVLVVTKPQSISQAGPGLFTFRGNVPNHSLRLPLSPSSRKSLVNSIRPKGPDSIKIHGPMIHQLPGAMNPTSSEYRVASSFSSSPKKNSYHKVAQAVHIPSASQNQTANHGFEKDSKMVIDYSRYHDSSHLETVTPNQPRHFINIKPASKIKLEPVEQPHYKTSNSSPNIHSHVGPAVHIHHPASSGLHNLSSDDYKVPSKPIGLITHIPDRGDSDLPTRTDLTSPSSCDFPMNRYDGVPHQGHHSHAQAHRPGLSGGATGLSHSTQNHLHVVTTSVEGAQSAVSPLHSPPPLRPAPSNQHRSIALRSPPNLTPSTVLSHFDFSPVTTTSGTSQPGQLHNQHGSPCITQNVNNGHTMALNGAVNNITASDSSTTRTSQVTVTLTYIPVKTQTNDKIVYVPVNQSSNKDRTMHEQQQALILYPKQRNPTHHYPSYPQEHDSITQKESNHTPKSLLLPVSPHDDSGKSPFSGVTRKFTVRTLQRDASSGALPSGLTSLRIQSGNMMGGDANKQQIFQTDGFAVPNGCIVDRNNHRTHHVNPGNNGNTASLPNDANENRSSNARSSTHPTHDVFSDEDDDDDDVGADDKEDYMNEGGSHVEYNEGNLNDERKTFRFLRGRKRGQSKFYLKRKGASTHQYKLNYKQVLEQARMMREQRPSFLQSGNQHDASTIVKHESNSHRISKSNKENQQIKGNDVTIIDDTASSVAARSKRLSIESTHDLKENCPGNSSKNDNYYDSEFMQENNNSADKVFDENNTSEETRIIDQENTENHRETNKKLEGKGVKRKAIGNSSLEDDFLYKQWIISPDRQLKKKKRNSTASSNTATKYLADPLEKVKLPQNPESWSENEVASFIGATECSEYAETLKDQEIDGTALLLLTRESLMEFTGMKLGPALKICGYVAHLKGRLRMQQNAAIIQS